MGRKRKVYLVDALAGASEEEVEEFLKAMKKRRNIWWILTLIPLLNFVFGSFLIINRNTIRVIESNGHKEPGGIVNILIALYCFIIPPYIMNAIIKVLGERFEENVVLGCGKLLKEYHYIN